MKTPAALVVGFVTGMVVSTPALLIWQSRQQARSEVGMQQSKESLSRARRAAEDAREGPRDAGNRRDREPAQRTPEAAPNTSTPAAPGESATVPPASTSNSAIMMYLGEAILAPPALDPRYSPQQLAATFRGLCEARGIKVGKLGVDTTEFPFVLHGVLEGENARDFFQRIDAELRGLQGYAYGGAVSGRTTEGALHFSLHMTPSSTFPREQADAIRRRLMLRLQMIDAAWVDVVR